jgi:hypothetical protein
LPRIRPAYWAEVCCSADYFTQLGNHVTAKTWHDRHVDEAIRLRRAGKERRRILLSDRFLPHELDPVVVSRLVSALKSIAGIKRVYLVRKLDSQAPSAPLYVLGVKVTGMLQLHSRKRVAAVVQAITANVVFPGETTIISVDAEFYKFARKMRRVKRANLI